jgi:hypothetical protein
MPRNDKANPVAEDDTIEIADPTSAASAVAPRRHGLRAFLAATAVASAVAASATHRRRRRRAQRTDGDQPAKRAGEDQPPKPGEPPPDQFAHDPHWSVQPV